MKKFKGKKMKVLYSLGWVKQADTHTHKQNWKFFEVEEKMRSLSKCIDLTYLKSVSDLSDWTGVNKYCLLTRPINTAESGVVHDIFPSPCLCCFSWHNSQSVALAAILVPKFLSNGDGLPP